MNEHRIYTSKIGDFILATQVQLITRDKALSAARKWDSFADNPKISKKDQRVCRLRAEMFFARVSELDTSL